MNKGILIIICILLASPALALTGVKFGVKGGLGTGVDITNTGINSDSDIDRLTMVGGQLKITTLPFLDFIGSVEYGWKTLDAVTITVNSTDYTGEYKFKNLSLSASAVYPIKLNILAPYIGFGIGTHSLGYDFTINGLPVLPDEVKVYLPEDKSYIGYHFIGGFDVSLPAIPVSFMGEFRYYWLNTPDETSKYMLLSAGIYMSL